MTTNGYYRARLEALYGLIEETKDKTAQRTTKLTPRELLKLGHIPTEYLSVVNGRIKEQKDVSNEALSFVEITTLNTWFAMHPDKVLGQEVVTTSLNFPLQIRGKREDVEQRLTEAISRIKQSNSNDKQKRAKMLKLKAKALLLLKL